MEYPDLTFKKKKSKTKNKPGAVAHTYDSELEDGDRQAPGVH